MGAKSVLTDHCASHPVHTNSLVTLVAKIADFIFDRNGKKNKNKDDGSVLKELPADSPFDSLLKKIMPTPSFKVKNLGVIENDNKEKPETKEKEKEKQ